MGIVGKIKKGAVKGADAIAKLSSLSPEQLNEVQRRRDSYLLQKPSMDDGIAEEMTSKMLAASAIEVYNEYLQHMTDFYLPVESSAEFGRPFDPEFNIRYFNITKWVTDKQENSLEKLVNVYNVLSDEECNIALVFHRTMKKTDVYMAVINTKNDNNHVEVENYKKRLLEQIKGNFPGAEWTDENSSGILPYLKEERNYSVASASNIPGEKSEKFISQTIEKLLDGIIPDEKSKEYTLILLATPILDVEDRKLHLAELYSVMAPYAGWQTEFTYHESDSTNSMATFGINAGVSAGIQSGVNTSVAQTKGETDSTGSTQTDTQNTTRTESSGSSISDTKGTSSSEGTTSSESLSDAHAEGTSGSVKAGFNGFGATVGKSSTNTTTESISEAISSTKGINTAKTIGKTAGKALAKSFGKSVAESVGHAVSKSVTTGAGIYKGTSLGGNFGANFARSSNVTATVGKNEGIHQTFTNYNIKHTLELLETQMKRLEQSTALGMWDFAAYVLCEDQNVANNVAHSYLALTQGESSYMSTTTVNLWRGDMGERSAPAKAIVSYLKELRHPMFGLNPALVESDSEYNLYPAFVSPATALSGKELAYSLNFPRKSLAGFPVLECAEFGRDVVRFGKKGTEETVRLGKVFHMNHEENNEISLDKNSFSSHTFITGSTGAGKSNAVYQILRELSKNNVKFLVVEPAKGEYKTVFGNDPNVHVYGTNPYLSPLLKINPFSFPKEIHVFEHMDRLVEIFNVCWPMYAAMPAVLKSAIERSYIDCGWDLIRSTNKYNELVYPSFEDVARNIREIIDTSEYDTENKGAYKGSLLTRLQSLTTGINRLVFEQNEIPPEKLFDQNAIVDLSRVGSSETKALIMGMLVLKLQEHRIATSKGINSDLEHVTVLEEAHNLLKRTSVQQTSENDNLLGKSVEMLSNAIAEMRTYGEGFIIVDQAPGLLDMAAIRNTNTKVILRLPDQGDRELVGRSANLNDEQIKELAKLPCGVAAIYQNEWVQPVLCKVDYFKSEMSCYDYEPEKDVFASADTDDVLTMLVDCLMEKELYRDSNKKALRDMKEMVMKSELSSEIKTGFMDYLNADNEDNYEKLGSLLFETLSSEKTMDDAKHISDINQWVTSVVDGLQPSIKEYSREQINYALAILLSEQSKRDARYNDLFCRFTEIYRDKGEVF